MDHNEILKQANAEFGDDGEMLVVGIVSLGLITRVARTFDDALADAIREWGASLLASMTVALKLDAAARERITQYAEQAWRVILENERNAAPGSVVVLSYRRPRPEEIN